MRVGRPLHVRGPALNAFDGPFSAIRLADGSARGFFSGATTEAGYSGAVSLRVEGPYPYTMGGPPTMVLSNGLPGSFNECGSWLFDTKDVGLDLLGFVHAEQRCNYASGPAGQTHKSMALAYSKDHGATFVLGSQFLTGTDQPTPGTVTGEGDCTAVNMNDGYLYAYCGRASDWHTIAASSPASSPAPTAWKKWLQGAWEQPGLGGQAAALQDSRNHVLSGTASIFTPYDAVVLIGGDNYAGFDHGAGHPLPLLCNAK